MAAYVGIQTQIRRNNIKSTLLLFMFPLLILGAVYAFLLFGVYNPEVMVMDDLHSMFFSSIPPVIIGVAIWFIIAFFSHSAMIKRATGSKPLERMENKRIYNLVENLTISKGMKMPKVNIIEDDALNAFASGINDKTYTVTLTRGIINKLNDDELEGVIAHELMHIRNRDVRLLIVCIIFVGIFSFIVQIMFRNMLYGSLSGRHRRGKQDGRALAVAYIIALIALLLSLTFRFAISRKREYMADAGAAEMTKKPWALASALRKISGNHRVSKVKSEDVAEMFIEHKPEPDAGILQSVAGMFNTHPPIEKRIKVLENF